MRRKILCLLLCLAACSLPVEAQENAKSNLQEQAEQSSRKGSIATTRFLYIRAFEDYAAKGQIAQGVECGTKATALYYKENYYKEAFDLLRRIDQTISQSQTGANAASLHYQTTKERLQMYMKMRKVTSAQDQLAILENQAATANDDNLNNDLLYHKALFHYTFGQNSQGNAVFKEMASKLTAKKEYDKVEEVYKTLVNTGRKSGNASLVAQSYSSYMAWKDSVNALKRADETKALKKQIDQGQAELESRDRSLAARRAIAVSLGILAALLAAALALGAAVLLRYILLARKQKKEIRAAHEDSASKARFISNIGAQLNPTLEKMDKNEPEVTALLSFTQHIRTLSELENTAGQELETEETLIPSFCDETMDYIRNSVNTGVTLKTEAPKITAKIYKPYVSHILKHLLTNATLHTPQGGSIWLDFHKRGPHSFQFVVTNTGQPIPSEEHETVFTPFVKVRDLTLGDGLGLPICKQMAANMNGDLNIDSSYTKGTRFILELHS